MPTDLRIQNIGTLQSFAVISDVHLDTPYSAPTQRFLDRFETLRDVEAIILLGDIFDFIHVGIPYFVKTWKPFFDRCRKLMRAGVRIYFVEGNHDFGFEHAFPGSLADAFFAAGDMQIELHHPVLGKVLLRHGDDVACPPGYLPFRKMVKSTPVQRLARLAPGPILNGACRIWANKSRGRHGGYQMSCNEVAEYVKQKLAQTPLLPAPDVFVMGHVHLNCDQMVGTTRLLIGPDWISQPNILYVDSAGKVTRVLTDNGMRA